MGYKGIVNGGLSYKFNSPKVTRRLHELEHFSTNDIIMLPSGFPLDNNLHAVGTVKTGNPNSSRSGDFSEQIKRITANVELKHGNVFQVSYIADHRQSDNYNIVGNAWLADEFNAYKAKVQAMKSKRFLKLRLTKNSTESSFC